MHELGHTGGLVHTFEPDIKAAFLNGRDVPTDQQQFYNTSNTSVYETNFMNYTGQAVKTFPGAINYFNNTVGKATQGQVQTIIDNLYKGNLNHDDIPKKRNP